MKTILAVAGLLMAVSAYAGESGFVYQGQTYIVWKDGQKVGKTAEELGFVAPQKAGRKVAAIGQGGAHYYVSYQDDGVARCYYAENEPVSQNLFCVKK